MLLLTLMRESSLRLINGWCFYDQAGRRMVWEARHSYLFFLFLRSRTCSHNTPPWGSEISTNVKLGECCPSNRM